MDIPILIFLCCLLAVIGTLQLMGRRAATDKAPARPSAFAVTLATPALLVPAALGTICAWIAVVADKPQARTSENPFGPAFAHTDVTNSVVLFVMAICIAGYVGLLQAWHRGAKPDGLHFVQGIKDHTVTFLLAKVALAAFVRAASSVVDPHATMAAMMYVAPSLLLAPLFGTAALHPRRPIRALKTALERCAWDLHGTGRILFLQILVLLTLWLAFVGDVDRGLAQAHALARESSTLSFNPFPLMSLVEARGYDNIVGYALVASSMVFSTVFMHLYFRRVMDVPARS